MSLPRDCLSRFLAWAIVCLFTDLSPSPVFLPMGSRLLFSKYKLDYLTFLYKIFKLIGKIVSGGPNFRQQVYDSKRNSCDPPYLVGTPMVKQKETQQMLHPLQCSVIETYKAQAQYNLSPRISSLTT